MKNLLNKAKAAADQLTQVVKDNPDLQKALADAKIAVVPAIQNVIETAKTKATEAPKNFAQTLQQPKPEAGKPAEKPAVDDPTAGTAKFFFVESIFPLLKSDELYTKLTEKYEIGRAHV